MTAEAKEGNLLTRPMNFSGSHLFVNVNNPNGSLRVEVLDSDGNVIPGFEKENCMPIAVNQTRVVVQWKNNISLKTQSNKSYRFHFYLQQGQLYSFWVSPSPYGESRGYLAAGSKDHTSLVDDKTIDKQSKTFQVDWQYAFKGE